MTVRWSTYAQSLTDKPVKGMLTGPVTMLNWSLVRDDQPRETTCRQVRCRSPRWVVTRRGVPAHRVVTPAHGSLQSGPAVQSTRKVSRSRCRQVSDARPRKSVVKVHLDSFPLPATRRLATAPRLRSALDQPGQRKAAAGSVRYDDNCRDVFGPSTRPVPLPYSCVTSRTDGVLP